MKDKVDLHSCIACDCGLPRQFTNLVKERGSVLGGLDWEGHNINGPRAIMMEAEDLQTEFKLSHDSTLRYLKALTILRKKHKHALWEERQ